ncbi:MAG TPA: ABC transporter ATP-binding protein [Anaerolineales bacterium]|nr:ABC transporter ATP-binding protein [Anaerolineales bacterium]
MGFFSNLDTEAYDRQYKDIDLAKRMLGYFRPYLGRLIGVGFLLIMISVAGAASPIIVGRGLDFLGEDLNLLTISLIAGAVFVTGLVTWGANWIQRRLTQRTVGDVVMTIRADAFQSAARHDLSFYDEFSSGRIVSRITSDTQEFAQVVVLITELISQVAQTLLLAGFLLYTEWRLALMLFVLLPLVFWASIGFRNLARRVTRTGMRAMGNVNAAIKETVSGIAVAKNFRQEGEIYTEFDESNQQSYAVNIKRGFVLSWVFPSLNAINSLGTAALVWAGGLTVAQGIVTVGAWYLFLLSLDRFWFPVLNLSSFWPQIQAGLSAAERVFALMDAEPVVKQRDSVRPPRLIGEVEFRDVWFRYTEQEQVLQDFNLHIKAGETIALVGHTGSGKSSLAKMIARFYEFQQGDLLIDGHDIRSFDLAAYRRQLGIVSQVPFLFAGTVVENIRYAVPDVTDAEIERLARQVGEGEWLETLPEGLVTEVGERGVRLSMGQRQLVALLRVLVQNPSIFILDEATASVDPFTEWQIQQALNLILKNATSILIAHRLSTVKAADRIIVLRKGQIIEEGDHETLMEQGGHYAELYDTYFRHQSLDYQPANIEEILRERRTFQLQFEIEKPPGD